MKKLSSNFLAVVFVSCISLNTLASTIIVNWDGTGDFPTIQDAIDAALDGDTVLVLDGVYTGEGNRDINFKGKAITVKSKNGPENCIIDCQGTEQEPHRGFKFISGENADTILSGMTIVNGCADKGGGIYCGENSSPTILACTIRANSNSLYFGGGGIFCIDNSPVISHCTISENINLHFEGIGAAIVCESSNAIFSDCIITENICRGIYCRHGSRIQIRDCVISRNKGYGIDCWDATVITNSTVSQNTSTGIYCKDDTKIRNCTISGNKWGIHCDDNNVIKNCIIVENTFGGVIFGGDDSRIINSIIARNTGFKGAGIFCEWSLKTVVAHCTISGNSSIKTGGGIHCNGSTIFMSDCILWGNTAPKGPEIYVGTRSYFWPSSFSAWYNDVQGGGVGVYVEEEDSQLQWYGGNINLNPQFISSADYHLQNNSPCIDKGTNNPRRINLPATDLDGNPRIDNVIVDMGAYEFIHPFKVSVDIKPRSYPNPVNVKSKGVLPLAILGSDPLNVEDINFDTILLEGVAPIRSSYEDVATPNTDSSECSCTTEGPDGYVDLTLKFDTQEIVAALGEVSDGDNIQLHLTGALHDGTEIEGWDCVLIKKKGKKNSDISKFMNDWLMTGEGLESDLNDDNRVDMRDLAILAGSL